MDPDALAALLFWLGLAGHCLGSPVGTPVARAARAWATIEPAESPPTASALISATPLVVVDRRNPRGRTVCAVSLRVPEARHGHKALCGVELRDGDGRVLLQGDVAARVVAEGVAVVHIERECGTTIVAMHSGRVCRAMRAQPRKRVL